MHDNGCAAPLYACFRNGISYGFIPGETLDVNSVRDPEVRFEIWLSRRYIYRVIFLNVDLQVYPLVSDQMAKIHNIYIDPNAEAAVWPQMTKLLNLMPRKFADSERDSKFKEVFPHVSELSRRVDELKALLAGAPQPIVLCHNDVLLENIVLSRNGEQAHFIDYEYAGPNCSAYDIANHFNEWAGECKHFVNLCRSPLGFS